LKNLKICPNSSSSFPVYFPVFEANLGLKMAKFSVKKEGAEYIGFVAEEIDY